MEAMVELYSPTSEPEAAVISSLLEAYQVEFFIRGGAFGKLYPGAQVGSFNTQTFMVPEAKLELARELISEFMPDDVEP